jgi:hypothetical protein
MVGAGVSTWALSTIRPASLGITRMQGAPYYVDTTYVRNQFMVRMLNKRNEPVSFTVTLVQGPTGAVATGFEQAITIGPLGEEVRPFVVQVPRKVYTGNVRLQLRMKDAGGQCDILKETEFVGPSPELLKEDEADGR